MVLIRPEGFSGGQAMGNDDEEMTLDQRIAISEHAKNLKNGVLGKMKEMIDKDPEKFSKLLKGLILSGRDPNAGKED